MKKRTLNDSAQGGIELASEDLDDQEIFFSLDQAEYDGLKIKPGQLVSYELCRGDNGRYYAINLKVIDGEED